MLVKNPFYKLDIVLFMAFLSFLLGVAVWVFRYTSMVRGVMPAPSF